MGLPSRNRSLLLSEKGLTYASTPRRKVKTAAPQRLPGRVKDGLLIMCASIYGNHLVKRLRVDGRGAEFRNTFDKCHWIIRLGRGSTSLRSALTSLFKQKAR